MKSREISEHSGITFSNILKGEYLGLEGTCGDLLARPPRRLHTPNQTPLRPVYPSGPLLKQYPCTVKMYFIIKVFFKTCYLPFSNSISVSVSIIVLFSDDWTQIRVTFLFFFFLNIGFMDFL